MFAATTKSLLKSICGSLRANNAIRMSSHFTYQPDKKAPIDGPTAKLNMFQAINNALDIALREDDSAVIFGEDVGFGGVFRCSLNLQVSKMFEQSNLMIMNDILCDRRKNMDKIVYSIRRYVNKELLVLVLVWRILVLQP